MRDYLKILKSLNKSEKKRLVIMSFFTFFSSVFELFSIVLIIPITKLILDNEFYISFSNQYSLFIPNLLRSKQNILITIVVLYLFIYVIKTLFLSLLSFSKFKFINKLVEDRTLRMMKSYLSQDIYFFNKNHSSYLIKNLITEISFLSAYYNSSIILISESILLSIVILVFIYYDPLIFLILSIYTAIILLLAKIVLKNRIQKWGYEREKMQKKISKVIVETFGAIKELILYDKRTLFFNNLKSKQKIKTYLDIKFSTINDIPKYFIELAAILGFFIIGFILSLNSNTSELLLVKLIFFGAILFKSLPSLSRIINSIQQIKFYGSAQEIVESQISLSKQYNVKANKFSFEKSLELKNIYFKYEKNQKDILKNFSLKIKKGDRVLITGKSGKGKSTLLDILSGFNEKYEGKFLVDGNLMNNIYEWRKKIGYLSQSFFILDDTIKNNIILEEKYDKRKFEWVVKISNLNELINLSEKGILTVLGERGSNLSGGEKQRIGLARALYRKPNVLILDEPTSSLDEDTANDFIKSIFQLDKQITLIMISHKNKYRKEFNKIVEL